MNSCISTHCTRGENRGGGRGGGGQLTRINTDFCYNAMLTMPREILSCPHANYPWPRIMYM